MTGVGNLEQLGVRDSAAESITALGRNQDVHARLDDERGQTKRAQSIAGVMTQHRVQLRQQGGARRTLANLRSHAFAKCIAVGLTQPCFGIK